MLRLSDRSRSVRPDRVWWRSEDWSRKLLPPHTFRRGGPTVGAWLTDWMISVSSCWKDWHVKLSGRQSTRPFWNPVSTYQVHNSNQVKSSHSSYTKIKKSPKLLSLLGPVCYLSVLSPHYSTNGDVLPQISNIFYHHPSIRSRYCRVFTIH